VELGLGFPPMKWGPFYSRENSKICQIFGRNMANNNVSGQDIFKTFPPISSGLNLNLLSS